MSLVLILAVIPLSLMVTGIVATHAASVQCNTQVTVQFGDTLSNLAFKHGTTWQKLEQLNGLPNPNLIFPGEVICLTLKGQTMTTAVKGSGNYFSPPQCTYYANFRYHQLHGIFVPWTTQSNANQWTARAAQFHWIVDSRPLRGDIFQLDAHVQGAYGLGHVGVVESVNGNRFVGSSMNWGAHPTQVAVVTYNTGNGVHFIRF